MLLTNQKTINYENLYEIQKGTTPFFFTLQMYNTCLNYIQQKFNFNILLLMKALLQRCIMRIS
jgi:hypothetical protein